jgi:dienelactone hydrolase
VADVLLLHSALGRRPAVGAYAAALESEGHRVVAPDLYDGQVFRLPEEGTRHMSWLGWERLAARAESAAADMLAPFVVIGMSMGAGLAAHLAVTRPGVSGVVLLYSGEPPEGTWPLGVPVQVHHTVGDPWADTRASCALVAAAARSGSASTLHLYRGSRHILDDADLPDHHDPDLAALVWTRVLAFLAELS